MTFRPPRPQLTRDGAGGLRTLGRQMLAEVVAVHGWREIQRRLGITKSALSRLLSGQRLPGIAIAVSAEGLGVACAAWTKPHDPERSCQSATAGEASCTRGEDAA
jgi:transcriptional regulator with XRE-family HTH domain